MAQAKIRMMVGRRSGVTSAPTFNAAQKVSAAFVMGAPVKMTSGVLVACATTNAGTSSLITYVNKSSAANMLGFAQGTAAASSTNRLVVARIHEGVEFTGNLVAMTAASAKISKIGSTVYLARRKSVDTHYGWTLDTPGANSASYVQGKITELVDAASTVNGRVMVTITKGGALAV